MEASFAERKRYSLIIGNAQRFIKEAPLPKRPTYYHRPESLAEALKLLAQPNTVPLAGGTKLLAAGTSAEVVDLQSLGLNQIRWDGDRMRVGATTTLADLAEALEAKKDADGPAQLVGEAVRKAGPNTYRNAATLGGTIAGRLADSEMLAALLVLDADLVLHGQQVMSISLGDYLNATERPQGLISEIACDWHPGVGHSARVARTPADYPIVSVTCWMKKAAPLRLAATGLSNYAIRLGKAEQRLENDNSAAAVDDAAVLAKQASTHTGDFRGDADYRADMAAVLTRRAVKAVLGLSAG